MPRKKAPKTETNKSPDSEKGNTEQQAKVTEVTGGTQKKELMANQQANMQAHLYASLAEMLPLIIGMIARRANENGGRVTTIDALIILNKMAPQFLYAVKDVIRDVEDCAATCAAGA